ncbi:MAG: hypothetical protein AAF629_34500 [Chloroflexota bacterium]
MPEKVQMHNSLSELPLFDLFNALRQAGLPLGIDDYQVALKAIQAGFGLVDQEALAHLCRALWIKSEEDFPLFNYHFEQAIAKSAKQIKAEISDTISPIKSTEKLSTSPSTTAGKTAVETKNELSFTQPPVDEAVPAQTLPDIDIELETIAQEEVPEMTLLRMGETPFADRQTATRILLKAAYFDLTEREMKQGWRYLRRMVRQGIPTELDVPSTIRNAAREGFVNPVLRPRRVNKANLIFLIDRLGSMVPFHMLGEQMVKTMREAGRLGLSQVYYFHDVPPMGPRQNSKSLQREHLLFRQEAIINVIPLRDIMADFNPLQTTVLIFSDAGAARGRKDTERVEATTHFLGELAYLNLHHIAWLNPMPQVRWENTTAETIARLVPMMPSTRKGFYQAIDVLRGHRIEPM